MECQWNGPVWPFQTTQALTGLANLLEGPARSVATRSDYMRLLRQYATLHMLGDHPDLQDDYDADSGKPIVGLPRSHHYFHSGFDDLIVTGLAGLRPRPVARPVDLAVNLVRPDYPRGSASVNADPASLHGALDGRVWFFPEMPSGWSTTGSPNAWDWFAVDLGRPVAAHTAELAFYADGKAFTAPPAYRLQYWKDGWKDVPATSLPAAVANGITRRVAGDDQRQAAPSRQEACKRGRADGGAEALLASQACPP